MGEKAVEITIILDIRPGQILWIVGREQLAVQPGHVLPVLFDEVMPHRIVQAYGPISQIALQEQRQGKQALA